MAVLAGAHARCSWQQVHLVPMAGHDGRHWGLCWRTKGECGGDAVGLIPAIPDLHIFGVVSLGRFARHRLQRDLARG